MCEPKLLTHIFTPFNEIQLLLCSIQESIPKPPTKWRAKDVQKDQLWLSCLRKAIPFRSAIHMPAHRATTRVRLNTRVLQQQCQRTVKVRSVKQALSYAIHGSLNLTIFFQLSLTSCSFHKPARACVRACVRACGGYSVVYMRLIGRTHTCASLIAVMSFRWYDKCFRSKRVVLQHPTDDWRCFVSWDGRALC